MTSKQRAALRGMANQMETILQVGKAGIGEQLLRQVDDALTARELIKMSVQENCPLTAREACRALAQALGAEEVQVIGRRFVLYRRNPKNPQIQLG